MVRGWLASLAAGAPPRVFLLEGADPPAPACLLGQNGAVEVVDAPRSATLLVVAGVLPDALLDAARLIHDQVGRPRCTVQWTHPRAPAPPVAAFPVTCTVTGSVDDLVASLIRLQADLVRGALTSEAPILPDVEPAPWRGVGPYGQGGTGMTGGVPYGRPLAETAADRDGLKLDQLAITVGPFFPPFPTGLALELRLQGDLVQHATVHPNPFQVRSLPSSDESGDEAERERDDPFGTALDRPVAIARLEMARARHHLLHLARTLRLHGLDALGRRAMSLRAGLRPGAVAPLCDLRQLLERTRGLAIGTTGAGHLAEATVRNRGLGPIARASGLAEDERVEDPAYTALGFVPVTHDGGDACARWRQRLAEAIQSVQLAARAGEARSGGAGRVEAPRGPLTRESSATASALVLLPSLLEGMEWGDAVATVVSLDLDLRDLPPASTASAGQPTAAVVAA
ncbi:MAG: hypothetical protein ABI637_03555 [Gemmatimonadota bacterium]